MRFYWLVLCTLAAWRITHLLQAEDGPWNVMARLRLGLGQGFWGDLLDCFYCLSIWIAAPLAWVAGESLAERLLLWPAISGAAILLERMTQPHVPPATYFEEEDHDAMLRRAEDTSHGRNRHSAPDA